MYSHAHVNNTHSLFRIYLFIYFLTKSLPHKKKEENGKRKKKSDTSSSFSLLQSATSSASIIQPPLAVPFLTQPPLAVPHCSHWAPLHSLSFSVRSHFSIWDNNMLIPVLFSLFSHTCIK